jgi:hypothetical protein
MEECVEGECGKIACLLKCGKGGERREEKTLRNNNAVMTATP